MAEEKEKPLTLHEIDEYVRDCTNRGGPRDLSRRNLRGLDLRPVGNGCLDHWDFSNSDLREARLPLSLNYAKFINAKLQGADFDSVSLWGADFTGACLSRAHLWTPYLKGADLEWARWDDGYVIGNEISAEESTDENLKSGLLKSAGAIYRQLKQTYQRYGRYDLAAEFYYREMEVKRKAQSWKDRPHLKLWGWIMRLLCGYGERPFRTVISALVIVCGLALVYSIPRTFRSPSSFWDGLYYSAVSFTAVGYGNWAPEPVVGWVKALGVFEAFVGVFIMALFLVTFTRKMT